MKHGWLRQIWTEKSSGHENMMVGHYDHSFQTIMVDMLPVDQLIQIGKCSNYLVLEIFAGAGYTNSKIRVHHWVLPAWMMMAMY